MAATYRRTPTGWPVLRSDPVVVPKLRCQAVGPQAATWDARDLGAGGHRRRMTTTLTAHGPEDLLAAVPVLLGFKPEESLVLLTLEALRPFHARVDLPSPDELDESLAELVETLLSPCRSHGVGRVALVFYGADARLAAEAGAELRRAFEADGVRVLDVVRAHAGRWSRVPCRPGAVEGPSAAYDDETHPFSAQAVFEGHVTHRSREELRATLAPCPQTRARWGRLLATTGEPGPLAAAEVADLLAGWVESGEGPDDRGAVRLLGAVRRVEVRDAALYAVTRDTARGHLRVWAALLRGAPDPQVPDVAAVTAFCAWQCGNGALAWCALDRGFEVDPGHRLATCLAECLTRAVPPTAWGEVAEEADSA
jgi:Domain of unknown function (DUF4192)